MTRLIFVLVFLVEFFIAIIVMFYHCFYDLIEVFSTVILKLQALNAYNSYMFFIFVSIFAPQ